MSHATEARLCAVLVSEIGPSASNDALDGVLAEWADREVGRAVFVADSHEFESQFGDDRHGAYDMEDRMNAIAAAERDRAIRELLARVRSSSQGEPVSIRLAAALEQLAGERLGHYSERALNRSLWTLREALANKFERAAR